MSTFRFRRRPGRSIAAVLAMAVGMGSLATLPAQAETALAAAVPAPASVAVGDATFSWGLSNEAGSGAFFGGCNFLSAGKAGNTGSSRLWSQTDGFYQTAAGNTKIEKVSTSGYTTPTWADKCKDADGATVTTGNNKKTGNRVVISAGAGTVDPAANTAEITWTGDFTVVFYGGLTYWSASDPVLKVKADGTGTVTATASGYGASMDNPDLWVALAPRQITLASLTGVQVTASGITTLPDYLGVAVDTGTGAPQPTKDASNQAFWGSFPQSFVDYQVQTGQASYWYTSGGARDAAKVASALTIGYTTPAPVAAPQISVGPADVSVEEGEAAGFTVTATGEGRTYQWQRAAAGTTAFAAVSGATGATYTLTTTSAADNGAKFRVVVTNAGGEVTSSPAALTVTPKVVVPQPVAVTGAQLEWAYSQYAQYGVFGPWSQKASSPKVTLTQRNGKVVSGDNADASTTFTLARFDGGTGSIDPVTGAGTITWSGTGDWVLNAYQGQYGAPDETLRNPALTIAADGKGTLSFDAYIPAGLDMEGNPAPAAGPQRIVLATFASVTIAGGVITAKPEFAGRNYEVAGVAQNLACAGAGGSWPTAWINFLPESVRSHYYTTSCSGLNTKKPPLSFSVRVDAATPAITTQPVSLSLDGGETARFAVIASGNPISYQWQRSVNGTDWTDIPSATDYQLSFATKAADNGAHYRVKVGSSLVSDAVTLTLELRAPVIGAPAIDRFFKVGQTTATLYAYADGKPAAMSVRYQTSTDGTTWTDLGAPVDGGETFPVPEITLAMDGSYWRAVFDNGVGTATTDAARIWTAPAAPQFTVKPSAVGAFAGNFVEFQAQAGATVTPISYRWESSEDAGKSWQDVVEVEDEVYLISSGRQLQLATKAEYNGYLFRAVATNSVGSTTSDPARLSVFARTGGRTIHLVPSGPVDPAKETTVQVLGEGFTDTNATDTTGALTIAITDDASWKPGTDGTTAGAVADTGYSRYALLENTPAGLFNTTLTIPAGALKAGKTYGVATFATTPATRIWDSWTPLAVKGSEPATTPITHATFEWAVNNVSQGGAPAGGCGFFVAGKSDGTDATYKTNEGNVHLYKRLAGGGAAAITQANRCLPVAEGRINQRILFTEGQGSYNETTGAATISWTGSATLNYYGGLVPFFLEDPVLKVDATGKGRITARVGGFTSSMDNPDVKVPLAAEENVVIADLSGVKVVDGAITATPDFKGVDYFPLKNANDPQSGRQAASAIIPSAKAANPNWGSWPVSFVDFQYRTGLSSYWHTSGLSADPNKPPLPLTIDLDGSVPTYVVPVNITVTRNPVSVQAVTGTDATFSAQAENDAADGGTLRYQWRIRPFGAATPVDIPGATGAVLKLTGVTAADTGSEYSLVITNDTTSVITGAGQLTVAEVEVPSVYYQPEDTVRLAGMTAYITAYTRGFPQPVLQWQVSSDKGRTWTKYGEPSTDANLVLTNLLPSWDGNLYRAVASNGHGTPAVSDAAKLTVLPEGDGPTIAPLQNGTVDVTEETGVLFIGTNFPSPATGNLHLGIFEAGTWPLPGAVVPADAVLSTSIQADINIIDGDMFGYITVPAGTLNAAKKYVVATFSSRPTDRSYDAVMPLKVYDSTAVATFKDTPNTHDFFTEIEWMGTSGISTGFTDGTYQPGRAVERQAMAAFLYRANNPGAPAVACTVKPFTDVAVNSTFCPEITWLKQQGITQGYPDGTFRPARSIERDAMVTFLYRLKHTDQTLPVCTTAPYSDVSVKQPFCGAIAWAKTAGVTTGFTDGTFRPNASVKRDAMAAFIYRIYAG
ncbi:hypothetical protein D1871_03450 [Nakamurella silvestris]|nr:hypothetical protein D1871_03450 [Nakamurella silvestris]